MVFKLILLSVSPFILLTSMAFGQKGKLVLKISDNSGKPIPYVQVRIENNSVSESTDKQGLCSLQLPKGNWNVLIAHPEYLSLQKRVTIKEQRETTVNLTLEKRERLLKPADNQKVK